MIPASFEYHTPTSIREVLALLRQYPEESSVIAGGHSLIPMMKLRLAQPGHVIDLRFVPNLAYIRELKDGLAIGPMTTYSMLESSALVNDRVPALAEAASTVGDVQVRNKGTLGGSLAHSDPAADLPAVVVSLDSRIRVIGGARPRSIPARRFFVDMFLTALKNGEIISEIGVPTLSGRNGNAYEKFANKASHFALVGVAASVTLNDDGTCKKVRVGITGAGPSVVRGAAVETLLKNKEPSVVNIRRAAKKAGQGMELQEDIHGSIEYREHLTRILTEKALIQAVTRALK